jgi:hypothetical protein
MNRLFRSARPGWSDYAGLVLFGAVYLALIGFLLIPSAVLVGS